MPLWRVYFMMPLLYVKTVALCCEGTVRVELSQMASGFQPPIENMFKPQPVILCWLHAVTVWTEVFIKQKTQGFGGSHLKVATVLVFPSGRCEGRTCIYTSLTSSPEETRSPKFICCHCWRSEDRWCWAAEGWMDVGPRTKRVWGRSLGCLTVALWSPLQWIDLCAKSVLGCGISKSKATHVLSSIGRLWEIQSDFHGCQKLLVLDNLNQRNLCRA